jgi:hypothetical protein
MMKAKQLLFMIVTACAALGTMSSCADDDSFTSSSSHLLTFSADTVRLDTVFSNVPSTTRSLWVYNTSGDGLRCKSVRLDRGADSGFRVNVDGTYLGEAQSYAATDVEVRNKDSIRVFIELTSPSNYQNTPQLNEDNLVFTLESGVEQRVSLQAYSWDATLLRNVRIDKDSTISSQDRPIVIYGGITVDSVATLNIAAGTTLYFHNDAGIDVYGRLRTNGTATSNVVLRGDRIDRMFDYLPYDFVPGQWQGLHFYNSSTENELVYTDIHSTYNGVVIDSTDVSKQKLTLENVTIHNCQGYGLLTAHAKLSMYNTQITNTLGDCVLVNGGDVEINNCTLAQFYPFDAKRGVALRFTTRHPLLNLAVSNTLVTGYADDQLMGEKGDSTIQFNYSFAHSIIRTPKVETADSVYFVDVIYEDVKDTVSCGEKHFVRIDTDSLRYDFRLDSVSLAIDKADTLSARPTDRNGKTRDRLPDIGAYEYIKP